MFIITRTESHDPLDDAAPAHVGENDQRYPLHTCRNTSVLNHHSVLKRSMYLL